MHDRVALITGGGTGIGAATAQLLAERGYRVAISGRREQVLRATATEIGTDRVLTITGDVSNPEDAKQMVSRTRDTYGRLDLLVNNAGIYRSTPAKDMALEDWRETFAVNLDGPVMLSLAAYEALADSDDGVIINVLSTLAHRPMAGVAAYCASKAALHSFTGTLALEWAADGIRVLSVSPGVVATPIHGDFDVESLGSEHPLGRVGKATEVAEAIAFLASSASSWTTGANLDVDGGIRLS